MWFCCFVFACDVHARADECVEMFWMQGLKASPSFPLSNTLGLHTSSIIALPFVERHQHVRSSTLVQLLERVVTCVRTGRWDLRVISKVVSTMRSGLVHSPYSPPSKRSVSGAMQTRSEVTDASVWSITSMMRPSTRRKLRFCAFTAITYKHVNLLHQKPSRSSRH